MVWYKMIDDIETKLLSKYYPSVEISELDDFYKKKYNEFLKRLNLYIIEKN